MMYGWPGWGMGLTGLVLFGLIVWLVLSSVPKTAEADAALAGRPDPRRILDERFARGEIDKDDYEERIVALERR